MFTLPLLPAGAGRAEPAQPIFPFHSFIWKIASRCNLNCSYCFVYNMADQRWRNQPAFMSDRVARQSAIRIREHCLKHNQHHVSVIFHGGEPLMGGAEHLRRLGTIIKDEFAGSGVRCRIGMQSNGLLFTPEIGDVMLEIGATMGVSLDGPPEINDRFRVDHAGRPSTAQLEERLELLRSPRYHRLFDGLLCVMDPQTDPIQVTDYLLSLDPPGYDYLLPHYNWVNRPWGKKDDSQATPYGDWLIRAFDHWYGRNTPVRVRTFEAIMRRMFGADSRVESIGACLVDLLVVETNGELEAVDSLKATYDGATNLGYNIFDHDLDTVAADPRVQARQQGAWGLCRQCQECSVVDVCGGGYLPNRYSGGENFLNPSVYCADLMKLIRHIRRRVGAAMAQAGLQTAPPRTANPAPALAAT
jgi:uncharacterized protein